MKRLLLLLAACILVHAQVAQHANSGYKTPENRARVASHLDSADRDTRQRPKELIKALSLKPVMSVADLGTGVGYMLPFLSAAVGPSGRVIAEDIFPDFLNKAKEKAQNGNLTNVTFILGSETDPRLPENSIDLALVLDAYHHFDYPARMLSGIRQGLRDGGRLAVVDYYKNGFGGDPNHIRLDEADVIKEIEGNSFLLVFQGVVIPGKQYVVIFEKHPFPGR